MRLIAITIYENTFEQKVAHIWEDDDISRPRYFESIEEIRSNLNPNFPGIVVWLNLDTLETDTIIAVK